MLIVLDGRLICMTRDHLDVSDQRWLYQVCR